MFKTSLYCYIINLKKWKDLHGKQLCVYILRQYCTKMFVKRTTQLLILYWYKGQYAYFEKCFNIFYLTYEHCMSAMILKKYNKDFCMTAKILKKYTMDFWLKCLAIWIMY